MTDAPRVLNARQDPRDRVPTSDDFAAPGVTWGTSSRVVRAGAVAVDLRGLDERLAALVDAHYEGFVERPGVPGPSGDRRTSVVDVVRSPAPRWLHLSKGEGFVEDARVGARWEDGRIELWSYGFAATFDREGRAARLLLCDGDDAEIAQAIENLLRFLIAAAALAAGGFLLHAAGVAHAGRAWLFFGPSGAGKSTTASHAPPEAELLGDDLILVEPHEGGWRACGVPFRGSFARGNNAATCAPVALACRIYQAAENRLEEVPCILRVSEVLAQVPFLMDEASARARAAERVEAFVRDVPVRRLHLRRDGSYWALLGA